MADKINPILESNSDVLETLFNIFVYGFLGIISLVFTFSLGPIQAWIFNIDTEHCLVFRSDFIYYFLWVAVFLCGPLGWGFVLKGLIFNKEDERRSFLYWIGVFIIPFIIAAVVCWSIPNYGYILKDGFHIRTSMSSESYYSWSQVTEAKISFFKPWENTRSDSKYVSDDDSPYLIYDFYFKNGSSFEFRDQDEPIPPETHQYIRSLLKTNKIKVIIAPEDKYAYEKVVRGEEIVRRDFFEGK